MMSAPVVECSQLCRRFGKRWAFAHVDLTIYEGERILVVGSNGSGKTTLLRTIATILPPSLGTLKLFGMDPATHATQIRERLALLSHKAGFYEDLSATENLRVLADLGGWSADVPGLIAQVGLDPRPDPVRTFSAGMRKRLSLAALLLQKPSLVLLDEPFAALDPEGMDQMVQLVKSIDATVIIASHQVQRAATVCDRALLLDAGLPRFCGPASQVWEAWQVVHKPLGEDP